MLKLVLLFLSFSFSLFGFETAPVLHKGRFIPFEVYQKQNPTADANDALMLPGKRGEGEWLPLGVLKDANNVTLYTDQEYSVIRDVYLHQHNLLEQQLIAAYSSLAGTPYRQAAGKAIFYPTIRQLQAEVYYYRVPWNSLLVLLYVFSAISLLLKPFWGVLLAFVTFSFHTWVLGMRCYILERPPVSNMFETVIYVPWVGMLLGFVLARLLKNKQILMASTSLAAVLLLILSLTTLNPGLENVQPVLDSQYWLIIHVLLVVGSYGAFLLSGVLGHCYLICFPRHPARLNFFSRAILQTMYVGLALLIPGTILGGIWAAESWGRFWDWDPKESWAFISICIYLICVHAYTFHYIQPFGLAIGAVVGLSAIIFTWYGVNYILGTGLHTYGFGAGGEIYFFLFLLAEAVFIAYSLRKSYSEPFPL